MSVHVLCSVISGVLIYLEQEIILWVHFKLVWKKIHQPADFKITSVVNEQESLCIIYQENFEVQIITIICRLDYEVV